MGLTRLPARIYSIVAASVTVLAMPAQAQQHDAQLWTQVNVNLPVTKQVKVTLEQIARFSDRQDGLFQTEYGVLLGLRVAEGIELAAGYRRVGAHNGNTGANENRLRQQVVGTFGRVTTRFRLDERFNPRGNEIGVRIRPLLRYNHPLRATGLALFASHESFILPNSTAWGQRSGYERMRNILGITVPLGRVMAADIGYLNQFRPARAAARAQMDHALSLQLTINLRDALSTSVND
ncbi:DUF2490 domain-containing protein [Sphingomonas qilianensis]|uniref:DUF2490 domain-containing protein n=1 Tax=Sphingomonas qilianensis TaxID=1736690 RepID=A0ABU9XS63_9SPHN